MAEKGAFPMSEESKSKEAESMPSNPDQKPSELSEKDLEQAAGGSRPTVGVNNLKTL
jgi:hypothetical protein